MDDDSAPTTLSWQEVSGVRKLPVMTFSSSAHEEGATASRICPVKTGRSSVHIEYNGGSRKGGCMRCRLLDDLPGLQQNKVQTQYQEMSSIFTPQMIIQLRPDMTWLKHPIPRSFGLSTRPERTGARSSSPDVRVACWTFLEACAGTARSPLFSKVRRRTSHHLPTRSLGQALSAMNDSEAFPTRSLST